MRPLVLAALLLGCSSPVIVVVLPEPDAGDTGGVETGAADTATDTATPDAPLDTGLELDATDAEADTLDTTPPPDAPPDTASETCTPLAHPAACPAASGIPACGPAPDGCGGKVDCGGCVATRRCAATASDPVPHCTCETITGTCVLYSGLIGRKVRCLKLDAPLAEGSTLIPQPDGSVTVYCIPSP